MLVLKFGGTSVGTADALEKLIAILKDDSYAGKAGVVVVSALSGITDGLIKTAKAAVTHALDADLDSARQVNNSLLEMKKRHLDISAAFLKGKDQEAANEEIEQTFAELSRLLGGIAILGELSPRVMDSVMSYGERLSAPLIARLLCASGIKAEYLDSRSLMATNSQYGAARVNFDKTYKNIKDAVKPGIVYVASGFVARAQDGSVTTLGRGGSDYSAAIYGAALDAQAVEIWTDVDGLLTANPQMVKKALLINTISYEEAMELSHFGAKVLHPPTVKPALAKGIPIVVRNTFNPACPGTKITNVSEPSEYPIRGVSSLSQVTLVCLQGTGMVGVAGFSSRLFGSLAKRRINVILISQASSEYSICVAVDPAQGGEAATALKEEFANEITEGAINEPLVQEDLSIIAVVGTRMKHSSGIAGKVFHALGRNGINVVAIAQGSSEINISLVVSRADESKALNAIHEAFFLSCVRSVNLFLVGCGLIGGTLLDQIADQRAILADDYQIRVNLVGVGDVRGMAFNEQGIDPKEIKERLTKGIQGGGLEAFDLKKYIAAMKQFNLPNCAFCDCTASDDLAAAYGEILEAAIPIITPNKRANSGKYEYYKRLTSYSRERGIPYLYETTVGAGLPVISSLRDLFLSGDKVLKIEAVLSGTLSFIFNNFDGSKAFSALVREAKAKGYTEPDPRDDLNAMDAARKALILAREIGLPLEFSDVKIEPILPDACFKAKDVESFFKELEKSDADFEKRRADEAAKGKRLRYVVIIENGKASVSLRGEAEGSPFLSLVDSDNIVVITTERYSKLPMVIKGPGAGAQVTAGGIFADIVRTARTLV